MRSSLLSFVFLFIYLFSFSQTDTADVVTVESKTVLTEVVVRSDLNVHNFLLRIKNDTIFYKAFKNLRVLNFTSLNDIRMLDKKGKLKATLQSKTRQVRTGGCRTMEVVEEKSTGDIKAKGGGYNYYTAQLYASLFFTSGKVCGETNIVKGIEHAARNTSGLEKHKEQLKMLFFNPGKKIPGIPFIGNKLDVFDARVAQYYNYEIDMGELNGQWCYLFSIKAKNDLTASEKGNIVFDNITTWFNAKTFEIAGRNYDLSYNAGVYDFDVHIEVLMAKFGNYLVPQLLRYNGNWDIAFKKRERALFTATLFDFKLSEP